MRIQSTLPWIVVGLTINMFVAPARMSAHCGAGTVCKCTNSTRLEECRKTGRWFVVETLNFHVCCDMSAASARHLAQHAEQVRTELRATWVESATDTNWVPKCQIVMHSSRQSYTAAVGRGSERTMGSSLVNINEGRVTSRRIDLMGNETEFLSAALPHELTHVVLRDHFSIAAMPRWADEGVAMMNDTPAKRSRHEKDLQQAIDSGKTFSVASLLSMEEYPQADRWGAYYGQSASLTKILVDRKTPRHFVSFVEDALSKGYDAALDEHYGIASLSELDRLWRRDIYSAAAPR